MQTQIDILSTNCNIIHSWSNNSTLLFTNIFNQPGLEWGSVNDMYDKFYFDYGI